MSAISVVLIAQMCSSCTSATPASLDVVKITPNVCARCVGALLKVPFAFSKRTHGERVHGFRVGEEFMQVRIDKKRHSCLRSTSSRTCRERPIGSSPPDIRP